MKRTGKWICLALAAAMLFSVCACNATPQVKPTIVVAQQALYATLGDTVTLPEATAVDAAGTDISADITVQVLYGSQVVMSGRGVCSFTPEWAGEYTARYSVTDKNGVASDTLTVYVLVLAEEESIETDRSAPVITVDTKDVNLYVDGNVVTKAASGYDEQDKDISADITVSVTDYAGTVRFTGAGNVENRVDGLAVGTYTVSYTLINSAQKAADSKSYRLTVVANDNTAPVIRAPQKKYAIRLGERHVIAAATASDYEDGALPVSLRVTDAEGQTVMSGSAAEPVPYTFTQSGVYTVEYATADSEDVRATRQYTVEVIACSVDGIVMDGVPDEQEYLDIDAYTLGVSGNTTYRFIVTDSGLYVGAEVSDRNLIVSNLTNPDAKLNNSDGLDFVFDPRDTNAGWLNVSDDCRYSFRVRVGVDGTVAYYKPLRFNGGDSTSDQWTPVAALPTGFQSRVQINGTIAIKGTEDTTSADTGYTAEVFFPWTMFGYSGRPDEDASYGKKYIRCGLGQRDVTHTTLYNTYSANNSDPNSRNNVCFNGMNVTGRPKVASEGLHLGLYSYLYVAGDTLGVNPVTTASDPVVLDGCMSEAFWNDAVEIPTPPSGQGAAVTTKVRTTDNGIYMGVYVADGDVTANFSSAFVNNYGISGNDMIDVRVVTGSDRNRTALVPYASQTFTDSKVLLFDPSGSMLTGMLQQMGGGRTIMQCPIAYGMYVDGDCAYSSANAEWLSGNQFVADTNNRQPDNGWGIEIFLPWETVGLTAPSADVPQVSFSVMSAVYDRNSDSVTNASWVYSYRSAVSISKSDPTNPSSYFPVTAVYKGGE